MTTIQRINVPLYAAGTYISQTACVYYAFMDSTSYLESMYRLSQGLSMICTCNFLLCNSYLFARLWQWLLFGELRLIESEHVFERTTYTMLSVVFTTTMFSHEDIVLLGLLALGFVVIKSLHWILTDRSEYIFEVCESTREVVLSRFTFACVVLLCVDFYAAKSLLSNARSPNVYLMFGFKMVVVLVSLVAQILRAGISLWELRHITLNEEESLEGKQLYLKCVDIIESVVTLIVYGLIMMPFNMPFMVMQDIVFYLVSFWKHCVALKGIIKVKRELDSRLHDVNMGDLNDSNSTCIVCLEEMELEAPARLQPKKLPCGHIMHLGCLRNWLERSQYCPTCRRGVLDGAQHVEPTERAQPLPQDPLAVPVEVPQPLPQDPLAAPAGQPTTIPPQSGGASTGLHPAWQRIPITRNGDRITLNTTPQATLVRNPPMRFPEVEQLKTQVSILEKRVDELTELVKSLRNEETRQL